MRDARPLRLIRPWPLPAKRRAQSVYWHWIDSHPCLCETLHGHCFVVTCPCVRHTGEVGAA